MRNVLFISDIRSSHIIGRDFAQSMRSNSDPHFRNYITQQDVAGRTEMNIIFDQQLQLDAWKEMKAVAAMLKFRRPFIPSTPQQITPCVYEYCDGEIYMQPYAKPFSAETRIIATNPYTVKEYTEKNYDDALYTHNIMRAFVKINNKAWDVHMSSEIAQNNMFVMPNKRFT